MGNFHNPIKFMTFHTTFKVYGKNQTILKVHDFIDNLPLTSILVHCISQLFVSHFTFFQSTKRNQIIWNTMEVRIISHE